MPVIQYGVLLRGGAVPALAEVFIFVWFRGYVLKLVSGESNVVP